jgi:hypothetical protein
MRRKATIPGGSNKGTTEGKVDLRGVAVRNDLLGRGGDLGIEGRARLSLECYQYTGDSYWLECAFQDCRKGRLDWDLLCQAAVGSTVPPPKSSVQTRR